MNNSLNELMQIAQTARQGGDRRQYAMQAAQRSPRLKSKMQAINGRSPEEILGMAEQMAQSIGVNLNDVAAKLGVQLPHRNGFERQGPPIK